MLGTNQKKLYVLLEELERYGVTTFKKTPFGSSKIEKNQIKIIEEYIQLKNIFPLARESTAILKNNTAFKNVNNKDMDWAKNLNHAIWRRH